MRSWQWIGLVAAFLAVHVWLSVLNLFGPGYPFVDVTGVYLGWIRYGVENGIWVGLDGPFVYPILALVPMLIAWIAGPESYGIGWLVMVTVLNAVALGVLLQWGRAPQRLVAAWWWLAFLLLIGPIALGRIDTVTVALSLVGIAVVATRPFVAGVVLAVATWIKVWPAALIASLLIVLRSTARIRVLLGAAAVSAFVIVTTLVGGGGPTLFSFLDAQSDRGLQIESPVSTVWMWMAKAGVPGTEVYYSDQLLTMQVVGPGSHIAVILSTPLMVIALLGIGLLAWRVTSGPHPVEAAVVLAPVLLAVVSSLLFFNKVGSPQFATWLAVPVIAGLVLARESGGVDFRVPAALVLVIAVLTQLIYPMYYSQVVWLELPMLIVLTVRNLLYLVLLIWSVRALLLVPRRRQTDILTP